MEERIDKIIASTGRWSRSEAKELIRRHRVLANGMPVRRGEEKYDPTATRITVAGEEISYRPFTWIMLHKPAGVLSATEDSRAKTVLDLLEPAYRRLNLFPVGRLDKDSEGLLLLTDDGATAHRLLSPRYHVEKEYFVRTEGILEEADVRRFAEGMQLGDGLHCLPAELHILGPDSATVILREGKFHQVKRMLAACGKPVVYLKRLRMGNLTLDESLQKGDYRLLRPEELAFLPATEGKSPSQDK